MLFKAIINRLNGGTDTASTKVSSSYRHFSRLVYEKYPNLPNIISRLFSGTNIMRNDGMHQSHEGLPSQQIQRVFLALEIIGRSGLPPGYQTEIKKAIQEKMECPIWAIRDKAATIFSLLIDEKALFIELNSLLDSEWKSHNALHGRLLCARFLISHKGKKCKGK